jgi:hypothetical protein
VHIKHQSPHLAFMMYLFEHGKDKFTTKAECKISEVETDAVLPSDATWESLGKWAPYVVYRRSIKSPCSFIQFKCESTHITHMYTSPYAGIY